VEFYFPGDIFGFDDVGAMHGFTTEAAAADQQTILIKHWRNRLDSRTPLDPMLALRLRSFALCRLAATRNRTAMLGLLTAVEKVWAFLMEMKDRLVLEGDLDGRPVVTIPIESEDIVDYLSMKPEMFRRSIQSLRRQGAIELVTPRRIKLLGETPFVLSATSRPISLNTRTNFFKAA
jgi:CRP/FNR family nitrogen fixation transcriptional regulator